MTQQWTRTDGVIIGRRPLADDVAEELRDRAIIADIEWFDRTPAYLGITVAVDPDGRVATLPAGAVDAQPGPDLDTCVSELALLLDAEVRIGDCAADHLPEPASPEDSHPEPVSPEVDRPEGASPEAPADSTAGRATSEPDGGQAGTSDMSAQAIRIAEITRTPATSLPLMASLEGVDMADLPGRDGQRIVMVELPRDAAGWNFGDVPLVSVQMRGGELLTRLVTDDHLEHIVSHNWPMNHRTVLGAQSTEVASVEATRAAALVTADDDIRTIAEAVAGADADALVRASHLGTADGRTEAALRALGLPQAAIDFLRGDVALDAVDGAHVHRSRGLSSAIGRSVDILLQEPHDVVTRPVWDTYHALLVERPWILHAATSVEALVGAGLIALAVRSPRPRSAWVKFGGFVGGVLVADSVADFALTRYLQRVRSRRS